MSNAPTFIRTYEPNSYEFEQLRIAAEHMTEKSPRKFRYYVGDTYFDFKRGWMWTTILCVSNPQTVTTYQALTPKQQEEIILSTDLKRATDDYFAAKWCPDRLL